MVRVEGVVRCLVSCHYFNFVKCHVNHVRQTGGAPGSSTRRISGRINSIISINLINISIPSMIGSISSGRCRRRRRRISSRCSRCGRTSR